MNNDNLPWFLLHDNPEELYTTNRFLVLDWETDTDEHGSALHEPNDIVLGCWQVVDIDGTVLKSGSKFGGIYEHQELLDDIATVSFVVAHNAKFEAQWLARCGVELRDVLFYDTLLAQWVLDGNRKGKGHERDLASLSRKYGIPGKVDLVSRLIKLGVPTRDIHPTWLEEYCHADVEATKRLFFEQQQLLTSQQQWHLVHTRNLTCAALADIEFAGLHLDPDRVYNEYVKTVELRDQLGAELAKMTGGINLSSPKQLGDFLYDTLGFDEVKDHKGKPIRTGKGVRSTNAKVMVGLKATTEDQQRFLEMYRKYNKQESLLEKNLEYFRLTCEQKGGQFFGNLKQNVVQTHRLASSGIPVQFEGVKGTKSVQFQNIPREYKRLFWSGEEGHPVGEFDSAQLEFRVGIDMSDDPAGTEEIESGVDVHSFTSKVLTEAGEPTDRQNSKQYTFKPMYGGGRGTPAVEAYCEYFKAKYKSMSQMQRDWTLQCADKKQYTTPYGMIFYFPDTKMQRSGYITNTTSISNYPIQGFATGEIIPAALVYFWHRTRGLPIRIFTTIHDSIAAKIKEGYEDKAMEIAQQSLTLDVYDYLRRVYKYEFKVPLGFGAKISKHWSDTKTEVKYDVWPDGRVIQR